MSRLMSRGIILLSFILFACTQPKVIYHSFQSVNTKEWEVQDSLFFNIPIEQRGNLLVEIELRHLASYPYTNIPLSISHNLNDSTLFTTDTLSILVADLDGHWKGVGLGSIFQKTDLFLIQNNQEPGNYTIKISHINQEESLKGVHDIGIKISNLKSSDARSINSQKDKKQNSKSPK